MSYDLGHGRRVVYNISSGKTLPPLKGPLAICDCFEITPGSFLKDHETVMEDLKVLTAEDVLFVTELIARLKNDMGASFEHSAGI